MSQVRLLDMEVEHERFTLVMMMMLYLDHTGTCRLLMHSYTSYLIMSLLTNLAFSKTYVLIAMSCITVVSFLSWVACEYVQCTHWFATGYLISQAWKSRIMAK